MLPLDYYPLAVTTNRSGFVCGDSDIDKWFYSKAWKDHAARKHIVTCASFEDTPAIVAGFFVLSTVVEDAASLGADVPFFAYQDKRNCPCLQITYMAMHKDHQCQDHGTVVLAHAVSEFAKIGAKIGIPALIVTPGTKRARKFYEERAGFNAYAKGAGMFMPLQQAFATIEAAATLDPA